VSFLCYTFLINSESFIIIEHVFEN